MNDEISKSQRKRDAHACQKLGEALTKLNAQQLATFDLDASLREAIEQARKITSHIAKKRQLQFIGKLMRRVENLEEIQAKYDNIAKGHTTDIAVLHRIETWRDRLMTEGPEALTAFLSKYTCEDRQALRNVIRKAIEDETLQKNRGAKRALFIQIKKIIS